MSDTQQANLIILTDGFSESVVLADNTGPLSPLFIYLGMLRICETREQARLYRDQIIDAIREEPLLEGRDTTQIEEKIREIEQRLWHAVV